MEFQLALLKNKKDPHPIDVTYNFDQLHTLLTTFEHCTKEEGKSFIDGHFQGRPRRTENLTRKSLLILDVDGYGGTLTSLQKVLALLNPYKFIAYSTATHTFTSPRIRIVLFFKDPISTPSYKSIAIMIINTLDDTLKSAIDIIPSITPNTSIGLPIISHTKYEPWALYRDGEYLNPHTFTSPFPSEKEDQFLITTQQQPLSNLTPNDIQRYLDQYNVETTSHADWLTVGMGLHHQYQGHLQGLHVWDEWSKLDQRTQKDGQPNYPGPEHLAYRWHSFRHTLSNPITFATVLQRLKISPLTVGYKGEMQLSSPSTYLKPLPSLLWVHTRVHTKGKHLQPLFTEENFKILLLHYGIVIKFDIIKKETFIFFQGIRQINLNSAVTHIKLLSTLNQLPINLVGELINKLSWDNKFNSWQEWIETTPWDGVNRLTDFYETLQVPPDQEVIKTIYLHKWLLQMIHVTCLNDEDQPKMARMVLTLQGKTFIGKTSWVSRLVPNTMYDYVATGMILDTSRDVSLKKCIEHVFVELGELAATYRKSDIEALKNVISCPVDILDIKYLPRAEKHRRRTVFCATVNEVNFLQDQTGNSRFLCLSVLQCNSYHSINMQQLYAQLLVEARANPEQNYNLSHDEITLQTRINTTLESLSPLEEGLVEIFDFSLEVLPDHVYSARTILMLLGYHPSQLKKNHTNELAKILDRFNLPRSSNPRGWYLPPKKSQRLNVMESFR